MKKLGKVLALFSSAVIAIGAMTGISASAQDLIDLPGDIVKQLDPGMTYGFKYFNDTEVYKKYPDKFPGVIVYQSRDYPHTFFSCNQFDFHIVSLTIRNDSWKDIYDKYAEQIGFNKMYTAEDKVEFCCYLDCNEYDSKEEARAEYDAYAETLEEKYNLILKMCAEMYKSGCLYKAEYIEYLVCDQERMYFPNIQIDDFEGTPEEAQEIVESVDENLCAEPVVDIIGMPNDEKMALVTDEHERYVPLDYKKLDYYKELYKDKYEVELAYVIKFKSDVPQSMWKVESKMAAYEAIKDKYPNIYVNDFKANFSVTGQGFGVHVETDPINLVPIIADIAADDIFVKDNGIVYGDLNSDGRIGIGDAIAINKFVNGSIILNEEQTKAADLNSDGTVNGDDLYTMLRYLVDDIDTLPLTE